MNEKTKKEVIVSLSIIQNLVESAYPGSEEARMEIKAEGIDIIDGDCNVLEAGCTPERAIERLIEDAH